MENKTDRFGGYYQQKLESTAPLLRTTRATMQDVPIVCISLCTTPRRWQITVPGYHIVTGGDLLTKQICATRKPASQPPLMAWGIPLLQRHTPLPILLWIWERLQHNGSQH